MLIDCVQIVSHDTRRFRFQLPSPQHILGLPVGQLLSTRDLFPHVVLSIGGFSDASEGLPMMAVIFFVQHFVIILQIWH